MGEYLAKKLDMCRQKYPIFIKRQGMGLLQGLWIQKSDEGNTIHNNGIENTRIVAKALEHGLILLPAGDNSLRFAPPLIVSQHDIDVMIDKLDAAMQDLGF